MGLHLQFIKRQLQYQKGQSLIFVLCVVLSMVSLVTLDGFSRAVHRSVFADKRALHGADITVRSRLAFSKTMTAQLEALEKSGQVHLARAVTLHTMARKPDDSGALLADLKAVDTAYPLYGQVKLASDRDFARVLKPGRVIVAGSLLQRLGLKTGDSLFIGPSELVIADVVVSESDRPLDLFSLGPRVFITLSDLDGMDLIQKGSRVYRRVLIKLKNSDDLQSVAQRLSKAAAQGAERVETFLSANSRIQRFFDNFIFYLTLIALFTAFLAGIGMQSTLSALLAQRRHDTVIIKILGATSSFLVTHFLIFVLCLGAMGGLAGIGLGLALQYIMVNLLSQMAAEPVIWQISLPGMAQGLIIGLAVVIGFTWFPLWRLNHVKPAAAFRGEPPRRLGKPIMGLMLILALLGISAAVFYFLRNIRLGLWFVLGLGGMALLTLGCTHAGLKVLDSVRRGPLALRQAIRGLRRPDNASPTIIATLAVSGGFILTLLLVELNLDRNFVQSFPESAPNLYFMDIQPHQKAAFQKELGHDAFLHGIVRARVKALNQVPIDPRQEHARKGDNLGRTFSLTARKTLLPDERLKAGKLLDPQVAGPQVSVLQYMADNVGIDLGDTLTFNIQGVPITATVTSIRARIEKPTQPFFVFLFPDDTLAHAPFTYFTGIRIAENQIPELQNRMAARFPNVTAIDVSQTIKTAGRLLHKLALMIRLFALAGILAGLLLLVGSILATRQARLREAVYFKILGAKSRFILLVFSLENLLIGALASILSLGMAFGATWLIIVRYMKLDFVPLLGPGMLLALCLTGLVLAAGFFATLGIIRHKPVTYLRFEE